MFDRNVFEGTFKKQCNAIAKAEKVTKETLRELSRTILEATHETGDINYVNKLLGILTPVNRRAFVAYAKAFTGFAFNDGDGTFTKKDKKQYDKKHEACNRFLEEPTNNLWSWAEINLQVEEKPLDLANVTKMFKSILKRAEDQDIKQADVLKAVFAAGVEHEAIIALMQQMADEQAE